MAFFISDTQQIRLRISREAEAILEDDMRSFRGKKRSSFVNIILENYYEDALSSISIQLEKYETSIEKIFALSDSKIKSSEIKILLHSREEELKWKAKQLLAFKKSNTWDAIRLRNDFYKYLTNEKNGSSEDKYYESLSNYLSTVIEEYTRQPYIKRERIYFKSIFEDIQRAINEEKQIAITKKDTYFVLPHAIMSNPLSTYSYLIGYAYGKDEERNNMKPCSYRISELSQKQYRIIKSKSAFLSKERVEYLHEQIAEKGVQFLSSELINVTVCFTQKGIDNFYRQINLRPTPLEPITTCGHPYIFRCSETQARYYFSQFGINAEILDPPALRKEFQKKYHDAYSLYSKSPC